MDPNERFEIEMWDQIYSRFNFLPFYEPIAINVYFCIGLFINLHHQKAVPFRSTPDGGSFEKLIIRFIVKQSG